MQKTLHSLGFCAENFPLIQIRSIISVNFTRLWHKCQRVFWWATELHLSNACWELWLSDDQPQSDYNGQWASYQIRKIVCAHAPGMPETFSPQPRVSVPDMHHGTCVTHVPWCMPRSLTRGFLWGRRRGKRSRYSRRMGNLQFYVSGKRPVTEGTVQYILAVLQSSQPNPQRNKKNGKCML